MQRTLVVHRRLVSAALAAAAVLCTIGAITSSPAAESPDRLVNSSSEAEGTRVGAELEVPIRLADPAVAGVLSPGDVVDVVSAGQRTLAMVVADGVVVTALPASDDGPWSSDDGLVMVAVSDAQALAVAGAAARGPVTIVLHR